MTLTPVERAFVQEGQRQEHYASERIPGVVEVANVAALGKLVALRFLEWVLAHPTGVISLPTGRTPEMFIAHLKHYRETWATPETQAELAEYGLAAAGPSFPDTSQLRFVALDEFFGMHPDHKHSFTHYIRTLYFPLLSLQPENILCMDLCAAGVLPSDPKECAALFENGIADLGLLEKHKDGIPDFPADHSAQTCVQVAALHKAQRFAEDYERRIQEWGGLGFWLGGIGPDGHIAFNMPGSPHDSPTRLVTLNYPTAAAASGDLGGIEYARNKVALTIGLGTITHNPDATVIVMAAGEGKARVVADAIERAPSVDYPATCLQGMPGARFYVSRGAAGWLDERRTETLQRKVEDKVLTDTDVDSTLVDLALKLGKRLVDVTEDDVLQDPRAALLLMPLGAGKRKRASLAALVEGTVHRLHDKITRGQVLAKDKRILHTAPHHDDIMLSYHAALPDLMDTNTHWFTYVTSGFHSVTNSYMLSILSPVHKDPAFLPAHAALVLTASYAEVVTAFVDAHRVQDTARELELESVLCLRQMATIWGLDSVEGLQREVAGLVEFFTHQLPGDKSPVQVQLLKGAMRETEADRMWALRGVHPDHISHLRSAFYTDDMFCPLPTIEDDALPMLRLLESFDPDIVTVAYDPEGTGPDTHYKVLQVVAQAMRMHAAVEKELTVWGYRNVWFRFHVAESTVMVPVNDQGLAEMNDAFMTCFSTQKAASFPAPDYDGPFSHWSEVSQREQRQQLGVVLGEDYFATHPNEKVRTSTGYVFLKEMCQETFANSAAQLRGRIESKRV